MALSRYWGLIVMCISLTFTACNPLSKMPDKGGSKLSKNQILRMVETSSVSTLDSSTATDTVSCNILNNIQEGLMRIGKEKKPEQGLAQDVQISPDKCTYTFSLRKDIMWSDGKKVTAPQFAYGWKRVMDPATKASYAFIMNPIVNASEYNQGKVAAEKVGVFAKDDETLVVKLKKPVLNFLAMTTLAPFYPQREDLIKKYNGGYGTKKEMLVCCGPFVVSNWTASRIELQKNMHYYDQNAVALEKVEINIVKDTAAGINLYNSHRTDVAPLNQVFVEAYRQTPDYVDLEVASTSYILFDFKNRFFQNKKIRRAMSLALDRSLLTQILKDGSKPAGSLIPPSLYGMGTKSFRQGGEIMKPNVKEAKKLFNEGMKELDLKKPPQDITMITSDILIKRELAVAIQVQLRSVLGLSIKLNALPLKSQLKKAGNHEFDMMMLGWSADTDSPLSFFEIFQTKNPMNYGQYSNPQFDKLVGQASAEIDSTKQYNLYLQAERILVGTKAKEDAALIPLYYASKVFVQRPYVADLFRHSYGPEYTLKWAYLRKESPRPE